MTRALGYWRRLDRLAGAGEALEQSEVIRGFCIRQGLLLAELFHDEPHAAGLPWLERPGGRELANQLRPGDHVVIARGEAVYTSAPALLEVLRDWRERNITLHIVELPARRGRRPASVSAAGEAGEVMGKALEAFISLGHASRGEAVREGLQRRCQEGRRHTRFPGYGYRWAGRKGQRRRVIDDGERATMRQIVEWRRAGLSWAAIASRLLRQRILTRAGTVWSPSRVRRACLAAVRSGLCSSC